MNRNKAYLAVIAVSLAVSGCGNEQVDDATRKQQNAEHIIPTEQQYTQPIIRSSREETNKVQEMVENQTTDYLEKDKPTPIFRRDAHAKAHGCVMATMKIADDLPKQVRNVGVFTPGKEYKAWIRYSSGNGLLQSDTEKDARGMAIKLMDVDGERLLSSKHSMATPIQDFLMINYPTFFLDTLEEYQVFARMQTDGDPVGYFFLGNNPFKWKWRQFFKGMGVLGFIPPWLPLNPLYEHYHSMTPYALGVKQHGDEPRDPVQVMRYAAEGVDCKALDKKPEKVGEQRKSDDNYLRQNLTTHLGKSKACFRFNLHLQNPLKDMPVEEPTKPWPGAKVVHAATITIPKQEFDTPLQSDFCESMAYSPWQGLKEHRPLGAINRVRKAVYEEISLYRHMRNVCPDDSRECSIYGQPKGRIHQPTGWCIKRNEYGDPIADDSCKASASEVLSGK
ncbi:MAG: catalase family protein [Halioglobus sp.]